MSSSELPVSVPVPASSPGARAWRRSLQSAPDGKTRLVDLPDDVLGLIIRQLDDRSVSAVVQACKELSVLAHTEDLWYMIYSERRVAVADRLLLSGVSADVVDGFLADFPEPYDAATRYMPLAWKLRASAESFSAWMLFSSASARPAGKAPRLFNPVEWAWDRRWWWPPTWLRIVALFFVNVSWAACFFFDRDPQRSRATARSFTLGMLLLSCCVVAGFQLALATTANKAGTPARTLLDVGFAWPDSDADPLDFALSSAIPFRLWLPLVGLMTALLMNLVVFIVEGGRANSSKALRFVVGVIVLAADVAVVLAAYGSVLLVLVCVFALVAAFGAYGRLRVVLRNPKFEVGAAVLLGLALLRFASTVFSFGVVVFFHLLCIGVIVEGLWAPAKGGRRITFRPPLAVLVLQLVWVPQLLHMLSM